MAKLALVLNRTSGRFVRGDSDALAETLERVLADAELARTLGDKGRQRVERHFCWSVCAQQMVAQYRACIDAC